MAVDTDQSDAHVESSNRTPAVERHVGDRERISRVVVDAMADALDCGQNELPPLHGTVDPEALEGLFGPHYDGTSRSGGHVEFTHGECEVVVEQDRVLVYCN